MQMTGYVWPALRAENVRATVRDRGRRLAQLMSLAMLAAASLLTIAELDGLIGQAIGKDHQSHPLSGVIGPIAATNVPSWGQWYTSGHADAVGSWILVSVIADGLFVVAYALILFRLVARSSPPPGLPAPAPWTNYSKVFLQALILFEALEAVVLSLGATILVSTPSGATTAPESLALVGTVEAVVASGKWIAVAFLAIAVLRNHGTRTVLGRIVRNTSEAIWVHRLSAVLVLALVILACIPSDGVLDQLPDVQRQWLDDLPWGALHYVSAAAFTLGAAAVGVFVLGRQRTRCSYDFRVRRYPESAKLTAMRQWVWWLIPVVAWIVAGVWTALVAVANNTVWTAQFDWAAVMFVSIPIVVVAVSAVLERVSPPIAGETVPSTERTVYAWLLGDVLAVLVLCVGGLGLVRSFAAPAVLSPSGWAIGIFLLGFVTCVLWPFVVAGLTGTTETGPAYGWAWLLSPAVRFLGAVNRRTDPTASPSPARSVRNRRWLFGFLCAGTAVIGVALVVPMFFSSVLGGVGVTVALIAAWGLVLGAFTVALQDYQLLAVFRGLRLKAAPVLTLAIGVPLVFTVVSSSVWGGDPTAHAVRVGYDSTAPAATTPSSNGLAESLRQRIADTHCYMTLPGGTVVKPVIVVAAEGGGIRAAYFTVKALDALANHGCLSNSVVLSSGVSGGSLGLALTKTGGSAALDEVRAVSGPSIVASGVTGLLAGDLVAADLGVHVPSIVDGRLLWRDRAALIEQGWINAAPSLATRFDYSATAGTGYALLNSTDARSKCRVIIGQLPIGASTINGSAASPVTCSQPGVQPAETAGLAAISKDECVSSLDWAGAAMLSARFPIITPAGRLPSGTACSTGKTVELIDGGYAEGSAIGTLADLAPTITTAIREYNASQPGTGPYAMPLLVFLRNSNGFDVQAKESGVIAEPLVPLEGRAAQGRQSDQQACPAGLATCREQTRKFADMYRSEAVVVSPFTRPTIAAPLGWALSSFSVNSLSNAIDDAAKSDAGSGYAQLSDLTSRPTSVTPPG